MAQVKVRVNYTEYFFEVWINGQAVDINLSPAIQEIIIQSIIEFTCEMFCKAYSDEDPPSLKATDLH